MKYFSLKIPGPDNQPIEISAPPGIPTGSKFTIGSIATVFLELAMIIGIFISLGYLVYAGIYWLQSKGDKEKLLKARRTILYAIFGLIVMSLSLVVVNVLATVFGVESVVGK